MGKGSAALLTCLALATALVAWPAVAHADELGDVRAEIAQKTQELDALVKEISEEQHAAENLDAVIEQTLAQLKDKQEAYARLQNEAAELATVMYKDNEDFNFFVLLEQSGSFGEFLQRWEMREHTLAASSNLLDELRVAQDELNEAYSQSSTASDQKHGLVKDLKAKHKALDDLIADLKRQEEHLDAEQKAAIAQAAAKRHEVAKTFTTASGEVGADAKADEPGAAPHADASDGATVDGTQASEAAAHEARGTATSADAGVTATGAGPAPADEGGWRTGIASAYGGSSDSSCANPGTTATGTRCDDWSVGVAVPLAWGPEGYYGRYVEISYEGQSIVAPIVDCGGMGGGSRALDLQPGVFKAFGAKTCDDWGLREVRYRFL